MTSTCTIEGCDRPAWCRGWCSKHYRRWQRQTRPENERRHEQTKRATAKYRERDRVRNLKRKDKRVAYNALNSAIRRGDVFREPCVVCGDPNSHGHHEDYNKPLEVIWLCARHHTDLHLGEGEGFEWRLTG